MIDDAGQQEIKSMTEDKSDFTQGSIVSKLLRFMIPILGALVLQAMYGAVDILVVGWFGTTAGISGVSTGSVGPDSIICPYLRRRNLLYHCV